MMIHMWLTPTVGGNWIKYKSMLHQLQWYVWLLSHCHHSWWMLEPYRTKSTRQSFDQREQGLPIMVKMSYFPYFTVQRLPWSIAGYVMSLILGKISLSRTLLVWEYTSDKLLFRQTIGNNICTIEHIVSCIAYLHVCHIVLQSCLKATQLPEAK